MIPSLAAPNISKFRLTSYIPLVSIVVIATIPVVLALTTWDHSLENEVQTTLRILSLPVILAEILVIYFASKYGMSLEKALDGWPKFIIYAIVFVGVMAIATEISLPFSNSYTVLRTIFYFIHLLFGISVWHILSKSGFNTYVFWLAVLFGMTVYVMCLAIYIATIDDEGKFNWLFLGLGVSHVRHLGVLSVVGTATGWGLLATVRPRNAGPIFGMTTLCLSISFWSGTRGSLFALMIALATCILFFPKARKMALLGNISVTIPLAGIISLGHQPPVSIYGLGRIIGESTHSDADIAKMTSNRTIIWRESVELISNHPFVGIGESRFRQLAASGEGFYNHPHNFLLQFALQWGLPALAALLIALIALLFLTYRQALKLGETALPGLLLIFSLSALAMIDGAFYYPYPLAMLAVAFASLLKNRNSSDDSNIARISGAVQTATGAAI